MGNFKKYLITVVDQETGEQDEIEAEELILMAFKNGDLDEWIRDATPVSIEKTIQELRTDIQEHLEHHMQASPNIH